VGLDPTVKKHLVNLNLVLMTENKLTPNMLPEVTGISGSVYNSLYSSGWDSTLDEESLAENHYLLSDQIKAQIREITSQLEAEKSGRCLTDLDWVKRTENAKRFKEAQLTVLNAWKIKNKDLYQKYNVAVADATKSDNSPFAIVQKVLEVLIPYINVDDNDKQTLSMLLSNLKF
jgi:hypothetical protein